MNFFSKNLPFSTRVILVAVVISNSLVAIIVYQGLI